MTDLWGQVAVIDGGQRLGKYVTKYRERWFDWVEHNNMIVKIWPKKGAEDEIRAAISDIALTMTASDWLRLPPMNEHDVPVLLPPKLLEGYNAFMKERILDMQGTEVTAASAAVLATKLSQYANGALYDEEHNVYPIHDEKLEALEELLESAGGPVLCFFQYRHDADRIRQRFSLMKPRVFEGDRDVQDWNAGKIRLLLAHPASTAYGLNMQHGGNTVVWFSTGWNLEQYQQANARLHRQGQTRPVNVYRLVTAGTIDERMLATVSAKAGAQRNFIDEMKKIIDTGV